MRYPSIRRLVCLASLASTLAGAWLAPAAQAAWIQDGVPLVTETHGQQLGDLVYSLASGAIAVWGDQRFGAYDVYAQRVDSSGVIQWSVNGVSVCSATSDQLRPAAVATDDGGAVVFWHDRRGGASSAYDIYAQRIDASGNAQWAFNGIPLATGSDDQLEVSAISDGNSGVAPPGWIVCWLVRNTSDDFEIAMQHVDATGGAMWTPPSSGGVTLTSGVGGDVIQGIVMVTDGVGSIMSPKGAVVAWGLSTASANGLDIYARRINSAGTVQWPGNGVAVCALTGQQNNPAISNVGGGNVTIAWDDQRIPDRDIYAQKLNSSGAAQWLANGLPVCRASGSQQRPRTMSDGSGGVFVVWEDQRSGVFQLYAQRIDGAGQPLWTLDGIPLCSSSGQQVEAQIIPDQAGGMIVAWADYRSGSSPDIYTQRVDGNGNLKWVASGLPLTFAAGIQNNVKLVSDSKSGVLAAWTDQRAGNTDVYINRAFAGGGVVDVSPVLPNRLRLALASSNPSAGLVRLRLELPEAAHVSAEVVDAAGRRVRLLRSGSRLGGGTHSIEWDRADDAGALVSAGVFFVRVRAGTEHVVARIVALR